MKQFINSIDHLVLTVRNIEATINFYHQVLGMEVITFGNDRKALQFGEQKINLHESGNDFEPKALHPIAGSADICFISDEPVAQIKNHIIACGVDIVEGPVARTGSRGTIESIYLRDLDGNLIEISNYRNS